MTGTSAIDQESTSRASPWTIAMPAKPATTRNAAIWAFLWAAFHGGHAELTRAYMPKLSTILRTMVRTNQRWSGTYSDRALIPACLSSQLL